MRPTHTRTIRATLKLCDGHGGAALSPASAKKCIHALQNSIARFEAVAIPELAQILLRKVTDGWYLFVVQLSWE